MHGPGKRWRHLHQVLAPKRHKLDGDIRALAGKLRHGDPRSRTKHAANDAGQVAAALRSMRAQLLKDGGGHRQVKHAAAGLAELEACYAALARAARTPDPHAAEALVRHAVHQLEASKKSAHAAGGAWPL